MTKKPMFQNKLLLLRKNATRTKSLTTILLPIRRITKKPMFQEKLLLLRKNAIRTKSQTTLLLPKRTMMMQ